MSDKSKMNTLLPFFHIQVPLTQVYRATSNPKHSKIQISENREEKRRDHCIQGRGREQKGIKE